MTPRAANASTRRKGRNPAGSHDPPTVARARQSRHQPGAGNAGAGPPPSVLTIAGSDSGGGAGIQADLRTFAAFRVHGLSVVTALTAQNTRAVTTVAVTRPAMIARQLEAVFDDFDIRALKIGMLGNRATIRAVARGLARQRRVPVVLDPVMVASSGGVLLEPEAVEALRAELLPQATLLTPNAPEAELLLGRPIRDRRALGPAARALLELGPSAVLLKGGHVGRGGIEDHLLAPGGIASTGIRDSRWTATAPAAPCRPRSPPTLPSASRSRWRWRPRSATSSAHWSAAGARDAEASPCSTISARLRPLASDLRHVADTGRFASLRPRLDAGDLP